MRSEAGGAGEQDAPRRWRVPRTGGRADNEQQHAVGPDQGAGGSAAPNYACTVESGTISVDDEAVSEVMVNGPADLPQIPAELVVRNPMGIVISFLQGDRIVTSGEGR